MNSRYAFTSGLLAALMAFCALIGMVQEIASRVVPPVVDYLSGQRTGGADSSVKKHGSPHTA